MTVDRASSRLFVTIVLDGVGVGSQPDANEYGDEGAHTLGHVCAAARPALPNLAALGLGRIADLDGVEAVSAPTAHWGRMREVSAGKDSTTGHWELAGLALDTPFPTYPDGFPRAVIESFCEKTGVTGVLGNVAASGTDIVARHGVEHVETGWPILYTSADSVFQIAAHTARIPLETLYEWCRIARDHVCTGPDAVGRVIARPFHGDPPGFARISARRRDYALPPPAATIQERLQRAGVRTVSVGKISDLFAGVGFDDAFKTVSNAHGIETLVDVLSDATDQPTFVWVNLVDFDQEFGHRNDPAGFARSLEEFDAALPDLLARLPAEARMCITADHGNDPCYPGTDHTREFVPVLYVDGTPGTDIGSRSSFGDHAATVASYFGIAPERGLPYRG